MFPDASERAKEASTQDVRLSASSRGFRVDGGLWGRWRGRARNGSGIVNERLGMMTSENSALGLLSKING